jgi:hypothetical protein
MASTRPLEALPWNIGSIGSRCRPALAAMALAVLLAIGATSTASAQQGAGYTSVNEAIDGTGHCANGNPNTNCNIYDSKEVVWLNGGPVSSDLGDGTFFFAVLSPSQQSDPNDGSALNLSDDFDSYQNRTFTISGGAVSYSGTHDFDSNKVRLMPYADTLNSGGVYILAICSLADGYPVDSSTCKYDAFKVAGDDPVPPAAGLTILKDAAGAYTNTYTWTIGKDVDRTTVTQTGGNATFNYTVTVGHDGGTISGVTVSGDITVINPNVDANNVTVPVSGVNVTDQLSDLTNCTVTNGTNVTLTAFETTFAYTCSLTSLPQGQLDNTATVTWTGQTLSNGSPLAAGSSAFTFSSVQFAENAIDECVDVTDTYAGVLGTVCAGDANPTTFNYSRDIPVLNGCVTYDNTATFTANDTGATGSSSQTVEVCGPPPTGALTMGFWKGPNGNSLIKNYCAPLGKTSLATYLAELGDNSGPFTGAAGKSCTALVAYVNGILGGASATDMNLMLRAQMLATALNVYFSDPALGYSTVGSGKVKPPSSFLTGGPLGGFNMDLTRTCPMVAGSVAGEDQCQNNLPSTDAFASGAFPAAAMTMQAILDHIATVPPFNGLAATPVWYGGDRTKQEIAKNVFDQFNNELAFSA